MTENGEKGSLQNELRKNTAVRSPKGFPNRGVCVKIELMRNNLKTQDQCTVRERNGQLVFAVNSEILLPENAPVRLTSAQLEGLDYRELYRAYSPKGRKSKVDPRVLFKVVAYGYQCGIWSSRKLEEACRYRVDFMWLLEEEPVPDHATLARFRKRCANVIEGLFYQYVQLLENQGETDHETVFIDGTKIESCAGRYTFCWRGSVEKKLQKVQEKVKALTELNRLEDLELLLAKSEADIDFVSGKGRRKSEEQRQWETLDGLRQRWKECEESLHIMGDDRNSYAKTDPDATFMRMKEDHMRNGQLKPAYNVQIAVNSEYITGLEVFSNRTDFGTLVPFLSRMQMMHRAKYKEVTADAGYESLENYLFLEQNGQTSFIKPTNYEAKKTTKYRKQIGRIENMRYDAEEDVFLCAEGRRLSLRRESTELKNGQYITTAWYRCEDCRNCPQREACCKAKDPEQPKELILRKTFWEKRAVSQENITSERGIYLRMCRSIQVEGAFALLKNDFGFRRFLTRGRANVRTEFFFLSLAFNLKKLWMKRENGRLQTHLSDIQAA